MKKTPISILMLSIGLLAATGLYANNIAVANLTLTGATSTSVMVQFDLSWDNSWRLGTGPANWDAAWVFVKFSATGGSGPWGHSTLNATGHTAPSGSTITPTSDGKGVFIYRSANGSGTNTWTGVQLKWDFSLDGLANVTSTVVQVFAIEMVYVPQGAFAAGSGGNEVNAFTLTTINAANATTAPSGTGSLGGQAGGYPTGQTAPTQSSWPNGYNAFYIMKYEASEEQWVSFFNTLALPQMVSRDITSSSGKNTDNVVNRNTVSWITGFATTSAPDRACSFLSWADATAYLDWAGLRPMTDLEFEKTCRGTGQVPVPNEFVWGHTGIHSAGYALGNGGMPNESITNPGNSISEGNANWGGTNGGNAGPFRCGIFAASAVNPDRSLVGAAYCGAMEMTGNLFEQLAIISSGNTYDGLHGDGNLTTVGNSNVPGWPGLNASLLAYQGGDWSQSSGRLRISERAYSPLPFYWAPEGRIAGTGFRGVRTAP